VQALQADSTRLASPDKMVASEPANENAQPVRETHQAAVGAGEHVMDGHGISFARRVTQLGNEGANRTTRLGLFFPA
jgi:hypothetical protein